MSTDLSLFLLSIRGTLASPTLEAARKLHNSTAGAPANIAAAKSLGDLSHMVYVPMEAPKKGAGEFLILDIWNSMDGLNNFFANPTVQEQAGQIFTQRDPVVWAAVDEFVSYHIPAPSGMNDRFVTTARGTVKNMDAGAQAPQLCHRQNIEQGTQGREPFPRVLFPHGGTRFTRSIGMVWCGCLDVAPMK